MAIGMMGSRAVAGAAGCAGGAAAVGSRAGRRVADVSGGRGAAADVGGARRPRSARCLAGAGGKNMGVNGRRQQQQQQQQQQRGHGDGEEMEVTGARGWVGQAFKGGVLSALTAGLMVCAPAPALANELWRVADDAIPSVPAADAADDDEEEVEPGRYCSPLHVIGCHPTQYTRVRNACRVAETDKRYSPRHKTTFHAVDDKARDMFACPSVEAPLPAAAPELAAILPPAAATPPATTPPPSKPRSASDPLPSEMREAERALAAAAAQSDAPKSKSEKRALRLEELNRLRDELDEKEISMRQQVGLCG